MPTTGRLIQRGFIVAAAATAVVFSVGYYALHQAQTSNTSVVHTQQVLDALEMILTTMVGAENGARGYLLSRNDADLMALTGATERVDSQIDAVATMTADSATQQQSVIRLRREAHTALDTLRSSVATPPAPRPVEASAETIAMARLRDTLRAMRSQEQHLLRERVSADERATRGIQIVAVAVALTAATLLVWIYLLLAREARNREEFVAQLARANEELEGRVEERTRAKDQALREAEAASRLKDEFLMTISHELRTPLTAIYGWSRMLSSGQIRDERRPRAIQAIDQNARALTQLVNDLLDVSRIISGKLRLNVRAMDVPTVVRAAVDSLQPGADAKDIRVETVIDVTPDHRVSGDPERLQQVAWNLLSNAIKFTPRGGSVQLRVAPVDEQLEILVRDTGQGIAPEFLPFVFDRFRQADAGTTRQHGGLGLGLAIARHLVELHGGSLTAESEGRNRGATFRVRLPMVVAEAEDATVRHEDGAGTGDTDAASIERRLDRVGVLIVDDEPFALELFGAVLRAAGADVRSAVSAGAALELLTGWSPQVLLSDLEMPGEDGYSLVRKALALNGGRHGHMVAVAVTARASAEDRLRALEAGFRWHLSKPVEPAELVAVIASLAGRQQGS